MCMPYQLNIWKTATPPSICRLGPCRGRPSLTSPAWRLKDLHKHFLFIHLPWACVCGFPPVLLYPWLLLNVVNSWRVFSAWYLLPPMPTGLKFPCSSQLAQLVWLLSAGLQPDIHTMPLFPSVLWVWRDRNQFRRQPLGKPSQNVMIKFHSFSLSQGRNWQSGGFLQTVPCQGRGLVKGRQKHHSISYPFECGCVEPRNTVLTRLKVPGNSGCSSILGSQ